MRLRDEPSRFCLVVIDMQNAYFEAEPLATEEKSLVTACNTLMETARRVSMSIVVVRTEHQRDRSTWTLSMQEDDQGFAFRGDHDSLPLMGLDTEQAHDVVKTRDNAFFGTSLKAHLDAHHVHTLLVCGVSTHTCVAATVIDAFAHDFDVILARDAIASHCPELHPILLDMLATEYRFAIMGNDEIHAAFGA